MADTYQCARCGGTFEKGWTDEEANAECKEKFGVDPADGDTAVLCDDCYLEFEKWFNQPSNNEN